MKHRQKTNDSAFRGTVRQVSTGSGFRVCTHDRPHDLRAHRCRRSTKHPPQKKDNMKHSQMRTHEHKINTL